MEILEWIGLILMLAGGIGTLIAAFSTSIWWGLGCLVFWPASLAFLFSHWDAAKGPFFLQLAGFALVLLGAPSQ